MTKALCAAGLIATTTLLSACGGDGGNVLSSAGNTEKPLTLTVGVSEHPGDSTSTYASVWGPWAELHAQALALPSGKEVFTDWNNRPGPKFAESDAPVMPRIGKVRWEGPIVPAIPHPKVADWLIDPSMRIEYYNSAWTASLLGTTSRLRLRVTQDDKWNHLQWKNGAFSATRANGDSLDGQFVRAGDEYAIYGNIDTRYIIGSYITNPETVAGAER